MVALGYLDWLLRAACLGFGAWLLVGVLARFDALQAERQVQPLQGQPAQVQGAPTPSPSPIVQPSPAANPEVAPGTVVSAGLSAKAVEVSGWGLPVIAQWVSFCQETRNGVGYGAQEQEICAALRELGQ